MFRFKSLIFGLSALFLAHVAEAQNFVFRNLLINGEALIGNAGTATLTGVNTTATYGADGFAGFANNAGSSVVVGRSTANLPLGFQQAFSLNRTAANTNTTQACLVQEVETAKVKAIAGQNMVLSAYVASGVTFSATSANAQITVIGGTGTDEGLATLLSGWTGATTIVANTLVPTTTTYGRVGVIFNVPTTVTELAVEFCFTPVGTAGATDTLFVTGAQLEVQAGLCPAVPVGTAPVAASAAAVSCASNYDHLSIEIETMRAARYFQQWTETAAGTNNVAVGQSTSTSVAQFTLGLSVPMRVAPTLAFTAGGLKVLVGTTATAITSGPAAVASSQSSYAITFTATTGTSQTLGQAVTLQGSSAGTGIITASARF